MVEQLAPTRSAERPSEPAPATPEPDLDPTYDVWLDDRTSLLGFTSREVGDFGNLRVLVFDRSAQTASATGQP